MDNEKSFLLVLLLMLCICKYSHGQTPANDGNWQLAWNDEFSDPFNTGKPDATKWQCGLPWTVSYDSSSLVLVSTKWNNIKMGHDTARYVTLFCKLQDTLAANTAFKFHPHGPDGPEKDSNLFAVFPYSCPDMFTLQNFGYGYYEAQIRLTDHADTKVWGWVPNAAFWQFGASSTSDYYHRNLDWSELDYCEIITDNLSNRFTCNIHTETIR